MKIECELENLKNTIYQVEKITNKNLTLPVLNSILLIAKNNKLILRATNLSLGIEVEIPAKIEKEGIVAVTGSVLSSIFNNINQKENIKIENENGNLLITTQKNKIKIKGQPFDDFPTIPRITGNNFKINAQKLIEGIKAVFYSASNSDIKPEIASVLLYSQEDELFFVATDSFRLAEKKIKIKENDEEIRNILIPFKNISDILRVFEDLKDEVVFCFNKNQISISTKNIYLTSRIIDGIFPDYQQIIPKEKSTEVIVLKQDLLNGLKLANIFSDKLNQVIFSIKPKEKKMEIFSQNNDIGENKTKLEASLSGEDVELSFNYRYFMDCFQSINSDSVFIKLNQNNKPMVIGGIGDNTFTYLIMPMNK